MTEENFDYDGGEVATAPVASNGHTGAFLDKAAILAIDDRQIEVVRIPEWERKDGPHALVRVRGLNGRERDRYEMSITTGRGKDQTINAKNARAKLLVLSLVNEDGSRMFTEGDIAALGEKSAAALERLFDVSRKLSGLSTQDMAELTEDFE